MSRTVKRVTRYLARRTRLPRQALARTWNSFGSNESSRIEAVYFDADWYNSQYPDVASAGVRPLEHYLTHGWREGRFPHPLINPEWIASRYPESQGLEPLKWFIRSGRRKGAAIVPFLDESHYRLSNSDLVKHPDVVEHFLRHGWKEGRISHPLFRESHYLAANADLTSRRHGDGLAHYARHGALENRRISPLFWPDWYRQQVGQASRNEAELFKHYLTAGWRSGASPNPLFDPEWYAEQLPESELGQCPLLHYLETGVGRGLSPHPLFDPHWYRAGATHLSPSDDPLTDFLGQGDELGRSPHPLFDPQFYRAKNRDYQPSNVGPAVHYLLKGAEEMRWPNPLFDPEHYACNNPDSIQARQGGLLHYLRAPSTARRHPHPLFDGAAHAIQSAAVQDFKTDPLADYFQFRSSLDHSLTAHGQTGIPTPKSAYVSRHTPAPKVRSDLISVLIPTYNSPPEHLRRVIDSVRAQSHEAWELLLVDDGSPQPDARRIAFEYAQRDPRIQLLARSKNGGISQATNYALDQAQGEYVALVDHDDVLETDALARLLDAIIESGSDAGYTDQSYVSAWGTHVSAFHKPCFCPVMLRGVMYIGHLLMVRRDMALAVGGFDSRFDKLQDFEFMLRVSERTSAIVHVPESLYHWRMIPGSIAMDADAKGKIEPLQAKAVNAHMGRLGLPVRATPHKTLPHRLTLAPAFGKTHTRPTVAFLIRGDRPPAAVDRIVAQCRKTMPDAAIEIVGKPSPRAKSTADEVANGLMKDIADAFSRCTGEVAVFVDPAVKTPVGQWVDHLLMHLSEDDVLAASPHLIDGDRTVIAAGSILSPCGVVPAMTGLAEGGDGAAGSLSCDREVSALNGLIMAIRVSKMQDLGGLDNTFATPLYAFADLTLRGVDNGLRNIAVAGAPAVIEIIKTLSGQEAIDAALFKAKHEVRLASGDRYYNANLPTCGDFGAAQ